MDWNAAILHGTRGRVHKGIRGADEEANLNHACSGCLEAV